jgi:hypothetical protein
VERLRLEAEAAKVAAEAERVRWIEEAAFAAAEEEARLQAIEDAKPASEGKKQITWRQKRPNDAVSASTLLGIHETIVNPGKVKAHWKELGDHSKESAPHFELSGVAKLRLAHEQAAVKDKTVKAADDVHWGVRKVVHEHASVGGDADPLDFDAVMAQRLARIKMVQQEKDEAERQRLLALARAKVEAAAAAQAEQAAKDAVEQAAAEQAAAQAVAEAEKAHLARMAAVDAHRASMNRDQWDTLSSHHGTIQGEKFDNEDGFGFDFGEDEEI